jgi:carbohydrate-selective porin OprB
VACRLALGLEGGKASGPGLGSQIGSQWDLNEVQESSPLYVAVLQVMGSTNDGRFSWQLGKISPKGAFDDNRAARSKLTKFMSEPLVRNSAVAFANKGFGGTLNWNPAPDWRFTLCASDANARSTEAGFTSWHSGWFRGAEVSVRSRAGATVRVLGWGTERGGVHDGGWGVSSDWEVAPGWVVFARAGGGAEHLAHSRSLVSGGLAWEDPFGRRGDFLALGLAHGRAQSAGARAELLGELVYRWQVNRWLALSSDLQHVRQLGGAHPVGAWVFGLRCAITVVR